MVATSLAPEQIKALRLAYGMSQERFAELIGLAEKSTVCAWEKGRRRPSGSAKTILMLHWMLACHLFDPDC